MKMENQLENQVPPVVSDPTPITPQPKLGFFTFEGRMNRRSFIVNFLCLSIPIFFIFPLFFISQELAVFVAFIVWIISFIRSLVLLLRRVHDLGHSGYVILATYGGSLLISLISFMLQGSGVDLFISGIASIIFLGLELYVLFWPGQKFENKYGPVPEKKISF